MTRRRPSDDELKSMLSEGHFGGAAELAPADPLGRTPMLLEIDRIESYGDNPRIERNPFHDDIRESIRHQGLQQPLVVTRRPGAEHYVVKAGGNTRLAVLKELHGETGDPRYGNVHCLFEPWTCESEVLAAHLIENDTRGELCFIDKARAVRRLKTLIESETGDTFTQERLAATLRERGYRLERSVLSRIDYAVDTLLPAIPEALSAGMGQPQIQRIRRLDRAAGRLWTALELGPAEDFDQVFSTLLARYDGAEWHLDRLRRAVEKEIAELAGEELPRISLELDAVMNGQPPPAGRTPSLERPEPTTVDAATTETAETDASAVSTPPSVVGAADSQASTPARTAAETGAGSAPPRRPVPAQTDAESPGPAPLQHAPPIAATERPFSTDPKSLRARACVLATRLAQCNELGDIVSPLGNHGAGFLVDFVFTGEEDDADTKLARASLWWFLATVSEQFHGPSDVVARHVPSGWEDRPVAAAISNGEADADLLAEYALIDIGPLMGPLVFARVDDRSWSDLVDLLDAYRRLKRVLPVKSDSLWEAAP